MKKRAIAMLMVLCLLATGLAGCGAEPSVTSEPPAESGDPAAETPEARDVDLAFFTGKVETVDLIDEIIADFNAQSNGVTVEQEYQNDASNIIKIKFASGAAPDIMTTYEQEYVDQGKYLDISDMDEWWDRLIPSMRENCTDLSTGNQYRICTNMTMAGFFYNKEMFEELGLTPATTWEDFVANLEAIKAAYPDVDPWFIFGSEAWHLGHLIEFIPHGYILSCRSSRPPLRPDCWSSRRRDSSTPTSSPRRATTAWTPSSPERLLCSATACGASPAYLKRTPRWPTR